ncbi:MAG: type I-C CRISPR-associated protein Cas8c/Csd1 [Candidatus Omnitrophica bacterium]|nr:type I-C CRISPR-associated protein Cas8c/Csd1 [Candidatus Omnitrophota bacterium]
MIKELSELGKILRDKMSENERIHIALKQEIISFDLVIHDDGRFERFQPIDKVRTTCEAVTAKKGKARLLLDRAEEVLCYGGNKAQKKHELFIEKLKLYSDLRELEPVLKFYKSNKENGFDKARQRFEIDFPKEKDRKGNIAFRLFNAERRIHEEEAVYQKVIEIDTVSQDKSMSKFRSPCSVCGGTAYAIPEIHEKIKTVPPVDDGKYAARSIVSYNDNAYESYELRRNLNSLICASCAKNYVEGLNWLLSAGPRVKNKKGKEYIAYTNRKNFGSDTAMVFWTRKNERLDEIDYLEAPNPADVARLIESVFSGTERDSRDLEPDQFYSCTLSGSAARISVRDWIETSLFDFRKSIANWFQDISIAEYDADLKNTKTHYPRLYDLARSCQRKNNDGRYDKDDASLARVATYLWNAALKNIAPPLWILTKVLQRARLDKYGITTERAALIKLILNRHNRGGDFVITEKIEQGDRPVAYVCGQIFAVLESVQRAALGKNVNAGIRERYFTFALTTPSPAFGRLFNLSSKHFTKLKTEKPGLAVVLDKKLQELCKGIKIEEFPSTFTLEEQGQFAIGYYHQKSNWKNDPKLKETVEEDENERND